MRKLSLLIASVLFLLASLAKAEPVFPTSFQNGHTFWKVFGQDYKVVNQMTTSAAATSAVVACLLLNWQKSQDSQAVVINYLNSDGNRAWLYLRKLGGNPKAVFVITCLR